MNEIIKLSGIVSSVGGSLNNFASAHPALVSALIGAGLGSATSGEGLRVRGAGLGAAAGFGAGLAGRGIRGGTAIRGVPSKGIQEMLGSNPLYHQLGGAALGGATAGAFLQPMPMPIIMNKRKYDDKSLIDKAMEKVKENSPDIERV